MQTHAVLMCPTQEHRSEERHKKKAKKREERLQRREEEKIEKEVSGALMSCDLPWCHVTCYDVMFDGRLLETRGSSPATEEGEGRPQEEQTILLDL